MLACSLGGPGHLIPLVAVAHACRRLGHEVLLIVPPTLAEEAKATGLPCRVGGEPSRRFVDEIWERLRNGCSDAPGLIDRELFADRGTQSMLPAVQHVCESWRPDLVVREPCEYASALVAHEAGIGHVQVGISLAAVEHGVLNTVRPIIDRFRPGVAAAIGDAPYLTSFPESLDPSPWADTRRFHQPAAPAKPLPDWWPTSDDRPLVYVTFGTVVGTLPEAVSVYRTALVAVSELPARVLLTVGTAFDVGQLGPVAPNTHVERWVRQADVLAHAAVVVCHGGSGTTFGTLAAGVPVVSCPLFADQGTNSRLIETAGVGLRVASSSDRDGGLRILGPADVTPLQRAIQRLLDDPTYRRAAGQIKAELVATPALDDVISKHLARS